MTRRTLFQGWCIAAIAALGLIAISIRWLDGPIAVFFFVGSGKVAGLGRAFGSSVLVSGDAGLMLLLAVIRLLRGSLPAWAKAVFIACGASLSAFAINDYVLKPLFGRNGPYTYLADPTQPVFNLFHGDFMSVFPSGHMVMCTSFAAVLVWIYPRVWPIFALLLFVGAAALLIGDWHFVSDILSGIFVGGTAGLMAAELWQRHCARRAAAA